ncbi:MAG: DUF4115 domain-containing protein [Syntrophobacterales bacterium]|jgi:cytoskeletal protein RodZ|nr:DUF4115 domain-containing protein [Syntrophobacterales bacterium]
MSIDLAKIGGILRTRREEKGLSVAQISDILCLRRTLIKAIETGDWGPLPHEVYVRGFIKKYGSILNTYDDIAFLLEDPVEEEKVIDIVELSARSQKTSPLSKRSRVKTACLISLAIVVLCFFVYGRLEKEKTVVSKTEVVEQITETVHTQKEMSTVRPVSEVSTVSEKGNLEENSSLSAMSEAKRLMITCHERTWISAVIDRAEKKEFMLSPHEIVVLNAKEQFGLLIGNAGGVRLILNGKDVEFTGKSGEVKRIDLS